MTLFRVEIFYSTKRRDVCCGMTIDAKNGRNAIKAGKAKVLRGYPARKCYRASAIVVDEKHRPTADGTELAVFQMRMSL